MKAYFQDIHYSRKTPNILLKGVLGFGEFFYKKVIDIKNYLYKKEFLKEEKTDSYVICVGNLTTGGVGKTPVVCYLASELSKKEPVAIISRGYGAKISNKNPVTVKDFDGLKFDSGRLCGDEPYQLAKKVPNNVIVIICASRVKAVKLASEKYGIKKIILDDGFSNRTIKKDRTLVLVDSKMRFGNEHLLPLGPLREPIGAINRADEIILVDKGDENLKEALCWIKGFNKPYRVSKMTPKRIYNLSTKAVVKNTDKAIAFCAIGQSEQFFSFAQQFYNLKDKIAFSDHYKYSDSDIKKLIKKAKSLGVNTFITTQKDEAKLQELVCNIKGFSFNVLELETVIE